MGGGASSGKAPAAQNQNAPRRASQVASQYGGESQASYPQSQRLVTAGPRVRQRKAEEHWRPFSAYPRKTEEERSQAYTTEGRQMPPLFDPNQRVPETSNANRLNPENYQRPPTPVAAFQQPAPAPQARAAFQQPVPAPQAQPVAPMEKPRTAKKRLQSSKSLATQTTVSGPIPVGPAPASARISTARQPQTTISTARTPMSKRWYMVIDLRGTIPPGDRYSEEKSEIIEVSIYAINGTTRKIDVSQFHSFVHPTLNPTLTARCKEFNRCIRQCYIDQEQDDWQNVLIRIEAWLDRYTSEREFTLIADSTSYERLMRSQCVVSATSPPSWATQWVNLRKDFLECFECQDTLSALTVYRMLDIAKLKYEGVMYESNDECFNMARIAVAILQRKSDGFRAIETMR